MKIILLISLILAAYNFTFAQMQIGLDKVREIKLLESNRAEVRRIFSGYKSNISETPDDYHGDTFYTDAARIRVKYSEGKCEGDESEGFDVSEWKAESVEITLDDSVKAKDVGIDLSKYKKERMYYDLNDTYAYYDKNAGILFRVNKRELEAISFIPPPKYYGLMCNKEKAKILSSTKSIFDLKLKDRKGFISCSTAYVKKLELSRDIIVAGCDLPDVSEPGFCSKTKKIIKVFTGGFDPEGDVLTYAYTISGGKIIGNGAKVIWDLSGVKPGTYTITAAVDDGCGFCGAPKTKSVVVKKCSKCR